MPMPKQSALAEPWRIYDARAKEAKKAKDAALATRDLIRAGQPVSDADLRTRENAIRALEEEASRADDAYMASWDILNAIEKSAAAPAPSTAVAPVSVE